MRIYISQDYKHVVILTELGELVYLSEQEWVDVSPTEMGVFAPEKKRGRPAGKKLQRRDKKRKVRLTPEEREMLLDDIHDGDLSQQEIMEKYGIGQASYFKYKRLGNADPFTPAPHQPNMDNHLYQCKACGNKFLSRLGKEDAKCSACDSMKIKEIERKIEE